MRQGEGVGEAELVQGGEHLVGAVGLEEDDDAAPGKSQACGAIGCQNGNRECATASGKIAAGAPPFVGEVSVSWTCYEAGPAQ